MEKQHLKQIEAFYNTARFKFILAGRRSGKTYLITEDILKTISVAPYGSEIFYIGPTNQQSKEIIWEPLEECLYQQKWTYKPMISKQRFELSHKRKIYVIGAEKISRIRGHKAFKVYLDELAYFTADLGLVWKTVRPTLTDFGGGAVASTTPNGKGTAAYDFYLATLEKEDWSYFHWRTIDNPYIDPVEISAAKREMDEKAFNQEYLATWETFEFLAYYQFNEKLHIKKQPLIDLGFPLHLVFDFNVNPTTLLISQTDGDMLRYKKEYSFRNSSTEQTIEAFCEDHKDLVNRIAIKIRGDATGKNRSSTTGRSDYHYVEEILTAYGFNFKREVRMANPPIIDRVKTVNGWLKPYEGSHRIEVDPTCKDLIRDLTSQQLSGRIPSDDNNLGHKADALGYDVYFQNLIGKKIPQRTIQL